MPRAGNEQGLLLLKVVGAFLVCIMVAMARFAGFLGGEESESWTELALSVLSRLINLDMSWPTLSLAFAWPSALRFEARFVLTISLSTLALQNVLLGWRFLWFWLERWGRDVAFQFRVADDDVHPRHGFWMRCGDRGKRAGHVPTGGLKLRWPAMRVGSRAGESKVPWPEMASRYLVVCAAWIGMASVLFLDRS